jgi:hypothetical protein
MEARSLVLAFARIGPIFFNKPIEQHEGHLLLLTHESYASWQAYLP